jgi:Zn-dependent protease
VDLDLEIVLIIGFLILSLGIHEAAHAWVAWLRGDDTARSMGRMTLNPIPHIDPFMTIMLPLFLALSGSGFIFGGAKPVPVNYYRLKRPLRDMMLVALAGPFSNFLLAILFLTVRKVLIDEVGMHPDALAPSVMGQACLVNIILAIFNMIPVPPLDGSRVLAWLLPASIRETYVGLERWGLLIVFALLMAGVLNTLINSTLTPVLRVVDLLSGGAW